MCNWSENIKELAIKTERLNAIERMINAGFSKEQIISCGYAEEEFTEAEILLYATVQAQLYIITNHKTAPEFLLRCFFRYLPMHDRILQSTDQNHQILYEV